MMSLSATPCVASVRTGYAAHHQLPIHPDVSPQESPIVAIYPPPDRHIRTRKVVTRSRARPTGKYPSWKMGRMIEWESSHELNAVRLLDADPAVSAFHEQPLEIHFKMDGEIRRHFPDLLVHHSGVVELWEIKPDIESLDDETKHRSGILSAALPNHGYSYRVISGRDLTTGANLSNSLTILRYGRAEIGPLEREQLRLHFKRAREIRWAQVLDGSLGANGRRQICRLILEGVIEFDTRHFLSADTILKWTGNRRISAER